jgi:isopenicillin N synthase-like dioxygenase
MQTLGEALLGAIAVGLGEDPQFFSRAVRVGEPLSCLRFNRYPVVSPGGAPKQHTGIEHHGEGLACEEHRDMSILTLLDQGDVGGLQIYQEGEWRDVPVTPGALVVNVGGGLQRWTNNVLVATSHRVRLVDSERISIPFFLEAAYDSPMDCLPATVTLSRPCAYEPTRYGPYINSTFKLFKEYAGRAAARHVTSA